MNNFLYLIYFVHLHAISNVAFFDLATPRVLEATHQYVPESCSFLLCIALRKNKEPSGRRIRCDCGSVGAVFTNPPSRYHSISGSGVPDALQLKVIGSFRATVMLRGSSIILGTDPRDGIMFIGEEITAADSELPFTKK